jgi:hypothetical protein
MVIEGFFIAVIRAILGEVHAIEHPRHRRAYARPAHAGCPGDEAKSV